MMNCSGKPAKNQSISEFGFVRACLMVKDNASQRVRARGGMADARGLGPREETLAGSSPVAPTKTLDSNTPPGDGEPVVEVQTPWLSRHNYSNYLARMKKWLIIAGTFAGCAVAFVVSYFYVFQTPATPPANEKKLPPVDVPALRAKAESGDPQAQAELGDLHLKGEAVTNSYTEAAKWFKLAVAKGNAEGQLGLGQLYEAGQGGVPKDLAMAVKLYRQAADQGLAGAQYTLGFAYEAGHGVPANQAEAAKWYLKAAEQGDPLAQYDIAQRYDLGVGVAADHVEALKWFILAARQGQQDSAARGDKVKKNLSRSQIAEAQQRADAFVAKPSSTAPK